MKNERAYKWLKNMGFAVNCQTSGGFEMLAGTIKTDNGLFNVYWGENNTAQLDKPNGTRKMLYQKTDAQICRTIQQVLEFNNYKGYMASK